ncbi:MAG TPA: helix-hairpin-helix domain-containing protein [Anaerolineae bacterium]|nr:helix-hairpin-helix domain-containing protein [Anaerolineae bacterium]
MIIQLLLVKLLQPLLIKLMRPLLVRLLVIVAPVVAIASFVAGALATWLLLRRRGQRRQDELARVERELAGQRARAMEAERRLAQQAAAPPAHGRGAVATGGYVSVEAMAAEADAAANLDAAADAQALDELLIEAELPLAEVEVLQASLEASQTDQEPVEIDMAALASRSGAVELLVSDQQPAEDDLTRLEGIGPTYAARLRQHGIATFARLAETGEAALAEIIQAPAWRRPNFADWIAQAQMAAVGDEAGLAALQAVLFSRQGNKLTLIDGLGQKYAAALQAAGIDSYAALAAATPDQVAAIAGEAGLRSADFSRWIDEAALRAAGKRVARRHDVDAP